jgi:hypothetical protein
VQAIQEEERWQGGHGLARARRRQRQGRVLLWAVRASMATKLGLGIIDLQICRLLTVDWGQCVRPWSARVVRQREGR